MKRSLSVLPLALVLLVVQGCATYAQKTEGMRNHLENGMHALALQEAEKEDEANEDVLACLNKGMLRRMNSQYSSSNQVFEIAKKRMEELYGVSITESAAAVTINEGMQSFSGDLYEQILLHAYMALNYLAVGDADAARVEILQADVKMREGAEEPQEEPFVRYLSGMIFEALGERDDALISYRKAVGVYKSTSDKTGLSVPAQLQHDFLRLLAKQRLWNEYKQYKKEFGLASYKPPKASRENGEVIVILQNGLAPVLSETSIFTFALATNANVKVALPTYASPPDYVHPARVKWSGGMVDMVRIDNIDGLARSELEDQLPAITARAVARAVIKSQSQKEMSDQNPMAGLFMQIANIATEVADTRSWDTLPQEIHLARITMPAGDHEIDLQVLNQAGRVVDSYVMKLPVRAGGKTFISKHWTAPRPVMQAAGTGQPAGRY